MPTNRTPATAATGRHAFVYGTLVDPLCLDEVLGHRHAGERLPARLRGYRRIADVAYPYPYIVAEHDGCVDGVLLMDLSSDDIRALDEYEDLDEGVYRRELVEVEAWGCGPRTLRFQAYAYLAGPAIQASTAR